MSDQRFTAEELRQKCAELDKQLRRTVGALLRDFQAETGLGVESIDIQLATIRCSSCLPESVVTGVNVRVGFWR